MNTLIAAVALACLGEAQVIGTVSKVELTETGCRAFVARFSHYQDNGLCPLDDSRLWSEGFEAGLNAQGECAAKAGDTFSGILVDTGDDIVLE